MLCKQSHFEDIVSKHNFLYKGVNIDRAVTGAQNKFANICASQNANLPSISGKSESLVQKLSESPVWKVIELKSGHEWNRKRESEKPRKNPGKNPKGRDEKKPTWIGNEIRGSLCWWLTCLRRRNEKEENTSEVNLKWIFIDQRQREKCMLTCGHWCDRACYKSHKLHNSFNLKPIKRAMCFKIAMWKGWLQIYIAVSIYGTVLRCNATKKWADPIFSFLRPNMKAQPWGRMWFAFRSATILKRENRERFVTFWSFEYSTENVSNVQLKIHCSTISFAGAVSGSIFLYTWKVFIGNLWTSATSFERKIFHWQMVGTYGTQNSLSDVLIFLWIFTFQKKKCYQDHLLCSADVHLFSSLLIFCPVAIALSHLRHTHTSTALFKKIISYTCEQHGISFKIGSTKIFFPTPSYYISILMNSHTGRLYSALFVIMIHRLAKSFQ